MLTAGAALGRLVGRSGDKIAAGIFDAADFFGTRKQLSVPSNGREASAFKQHV